MLKSKMAVPDPISTQISELVSMLCRISKVQHVRGELLFAQGKEMHYLDRHILCREKWLFQKIEVPYEEDLELWFVKPVERWNHGHWS